MTNFSNQPLHEPDIHYNSQGIPMLPICDFQQAKETVECYRTHELQHKEQNSSCGIDSIVNALRASEWPSDPGWLAGFFSCASQMYGINERLTGGLLDALGMIQFGNSLMAAIIVSAEKWVESVEDNALDEEIDKINKGE